jgi:uncharacterized protein (UPF0332 family)
LLGEAKKVDIKVLLFAIDLIAAEHSCQINAIYQQFYTTSQLETQLMIWKIADVDWIIEVVERLDIKN